MVNNKRFTIKFVCMLFVSCLFVTGCASQTSEEQQPKAVSQSNQKNVEQPSDSVKQLSSQQTATLETSQGVLEIEPTVVSATDATIAERNNTEKDFTGEYYDPLEPLNRAVFKFNHEFYTYVFIPVAKGYDFIVPDVSKDNVDNVFSNLREPLNLVNNAFSLKGAEATRNIGRFLVNSTLGVFGIFDVADDWFNIKPAHQNLSDTLSSYSVGDGAYLVLPIFGPSDVKNATSTITEGIFHPVNLTIASPESTAILVTNGVHDFTYQVELYKTLRAQSKDPYIYFRNQHIQAKNRDELAQKEQKGQFFNREGNKD